MLKQGENLCPPLISYNLFLWPYTVEKQFPGCLKITPNSCTLELTYLAKLRGWLHEPGPAWFAGMKFIPGSHAASQPVMGKLALAPTHDLALKLWCAVLWLARIAGLTRRTQSHGKKLSLVNRDPGIVLPGSQSAELAGSSCNRQVDFWFVLY